MRNNDRFCTFVVDNYTSDILNSIWQYGLHINDKKITDIIKYGNNTYRINLINLNDDEYNKYEKYFGPVIEPVMITINSVIIYMDDKDTIYIGIN